MVTTHIFIYFAVGVHYFNLTLDSAHLYLVALCIVTLRLAITESVPEQQCCGSYITGLLPVLSLPSKGFRLLVLGARSNALALNRASTAASSIDSVLPVRANGFLLAALGVKSSATPLSVVRAARGGPAVATAAAREM